MTEDEHSCSLETSGQVSDSDKARAEEIKNEANIAFKGMIARLSWYGLPVAP